MTRTERAMNPRAIIKDRSESKSGLDKSLRKNGAGTHNWGSIRDELQHEQDALDDEDLDDDEVGGVPEQPNAAIRPSIDGPTETISVEGANGSPTEEEVEKARQFRAQGLKGNVDLAAIARTSAAVSGSPPKASSVEVTRNAETGTLP